MIAKALYELRLGMLAISLCICAVSLGVLAQAPPTNNLSPELNSQRILDLRERMDRLDAQNLGSRVSVLEEMARQNKWMLGGIFLCLLPISINAFFQLAKKKAQ